jgi:hypothetical protein
MSSRQVPLDKYGRGAAKKTKLFAEHVLTEYTAHDSFQYPPTMAANETAQPNRSLTTEDDIRSRCNLVGDTSSQEENIVENKILATQAKTIYLFW